MTVKNLEYTVVSRIVTQLAYPTGTGNYNNSISAGQVHSEFKDITEIHKFPALTIGSVRIGGSGAFVRNSFEVPIEVEIFGYVKDQDDPMQGALKLLSDVRVAITYDEWLNNNINGLGFSAEAGAMDGYGVILFTLRGTMEHRS